MSDNSENAQTKPTIETVLERINSLGTNLQGQISELNDRVGSLQTNVQALQTDFHSLQTNVQSLQTDFHSSQTDQRSLRDEFQLFRGEVEVRLDRIEGMTNQTRAEMLNLRADFREWRRELKEAPA